MPTSVNLLVSAAEANQLAALVSKMEPVEEASEPSPLDPGSPLNAGIGVDEIRNAMEFVTIVLSTGTSALTFLKLLRDELREWTGGPLGVAVPGKPSSPNAITASSSDSELERLVT